MEKVTKIFEVYTYDELDKKIQEELLEKEIDYCVESYCEHCLMEDMTYYAEYLLQKYFGQKAELKNVYYDLSYSQGSGAMIVFELKYYNSKISVKHYGHYNHEYSFELDYKNDSYLSDKREEYLKEKIVNMNGELKNYGYELIDYTNFIDEAKDNLQEYHFLNNGKIFV